nr:uncharacterized protein LOC111506523 [Leptinotarsa decemlineata]
MDLLKTILSSCECEELYDNFKNNNIDTETLKILSDEDLQIVGIQDEKKREKILLKLNNLRIPAEKKIDLLVDKEYINRALRDMSEHLNGHLALLICADYRKDIDLCDIRLTPAVNCLENVLCSLEKEIDSFKSKISRQNEAKRKKLGKLYIILPTVAAMTVVIYFCKKYVCT